MSQEDIKAMSNNTANQNGSSKESKELALHYMQTLVDVARESFLILDSQIKVISANPTFYQNFRVSPEQTEGKLLYELGNGQWNVPELKRLLEEILPNKKEVRDYAVTHAFETIGERTIQLNAKQIDSVQLIILAMEDITDRKSLEEKLAEHTEDLEAQIVQRTAELSDRVKELETINKSMVGRELKMVELKKEIENLKKRLGNGNGFNKPTTGGKNGNGHNGNKTLT